MSFHMFQDTNPHETQSFAHFVVQLSVDNSQKVCSKIFNNSSDKLRLATSSKDFVNLRVTQVILAIHEKLHNKM